MKLGDKIKLHYERKATFSDKLEVVDGVFTIISVSYELPHCFGNKSWSPGFNSFEYGEEQAGRPDVVRLGSIYVPSHEYLDKQSMNKMTYNNKTVSWEILTTGNDLITSDLIDNKQLSESQGSLQSKQEEQ